MWNSFGKLSCVLVTGWRGRWEKLAGDDKNKEKLRVGLLCGPLHCVESPKVMTELWTEENYELPSRTWMRGCDLRRNHDNEEGMVVKTTKAGVSFFCREVLESYVFYTRVVVIYLAIQKKKKREATHTSYLLILRPKCMTWPNFRGYCVLMFNWDKPVEGVLCERWGY